MTGFGAATLEASGWSVRVEIRTVNHRHLQVKARLPSELASVEPAVEGAVRKTLERGAVTINVALTHELSAVQASFDVELARRYQKQLRKLAKELELDDDIHLETLLALPGVIGAVADEDGTGRDEKLVLRAVRDALAALVEMREREGASLAADLERNAKAVARIAARIDKRMPDVVREHHKSLERRLNELLDSRSAVQEAELPRELALLADRMDVGEEISRLASHLEQLGRLLGEGGAIGRKLEFLVQELFREANTIGAKCNDATVAHDVVDMKTHIERLREQVQNVE